MLGIVVSEADEASVHIGEKLRTLSEWTERTDRTHLPANGGGQYWTTDGASLRTIEGLHLNTDGMAAVFDDVSLVVFVSRHSGKTGRLLSVHFTGNLGPAQYGGEAGSLAEAAPGAVSPVLDALGKGAPEGYEVSMECTHHGPSSVGAPSLFVELGSDSDAWRDPAGAKAVAEATLSLRGVDPSSERAVVCIGGGHYAARATRIALETDWHVGHIAAEWALEDLSGPSEEVVRQLFERSGARLAVIEGEHQRIRRTIQDSGYRIVSEQWLHETVGVPQERAKALETKLCSVEDGLRFGELAKSARTWMIRDLPSELLQRCLGDDADRTRAALESHTVAYVAADGGSRVGDRGALREDADLDRLTERLADLLGEHHDEVRHEDDEIVVSDSVFDPETARDLGVPEGPAFGRLAEGEPVTVGGETVTPDEVHRQRTWRFEV